MTVLNERSTQLAVELEVPGPIDLAHPARADLGGDLVGSRGACPGSGTWRGTGVIIQERGLGFAAPDIDD